MFDVRMGEMNVTAVGRDAHIPPQVSAGRSPHGAENIADADPAGSPAKTKSPDIVLPISGRSLRGTTRFRPKGRTYGDRQSLSL